MKKYNIILVLFLAFIFGATSLNAQFRIQNNEFIQIGYDDYRTLTFGDANTTPNNGRYAIEYLGGGLNFWKPWPTSNYGNHILFLRDDKNVGIGYKGSVLYRADINGKVRCQNITFFSDNRVKSNVQPLSNSLEKLMQLNAVSYDYDYRARQETSIDEKDLTEAKINTLKADEDLVLEEENRMGFIAQEVREILPQVVDEDENGLLGINYIDLIPVLISGVKEQQQIIEDLQAQLTALQGTSDEDNPAVKSLLFSNVPNPFNGNTTIQYAITAKDAGKQLSIMVHDANGRLVWSEDKIATLGKGSLDIDAQQLAGGAYFYSLALDGVILDTKTMLKAAANH